MAIGEYLYKYEANQLRNMVQQPDWYLEFGAMKKARLLGSASIQAAFHGNIAQAASNARERTLTIFEELLQQGAITLGQADQNLENWDEERLPISKVVVHHTGKPPGLRKERLNALHLLRLYVPRYQSKSSPVLDKSGERQPIYSGHFDKDGNPVFYGYHWLVRQNGEVERILPDSALAWHANNWDINRESTAFCIDDDLTHKRPSEAVLSGIKNIVKHDYPDLVITPTTLLGHKEITDTACPGEEFLGDDGWKKQLIDQLSH